MTRWRVFPEQHKSAVSLLVINLLSGSLVGSPWLSAQQAASTPATSPSVAFTGVTVIDVVQGRPLAEQTVVVVGSRIEAVGSAKKVNVPADARVVNAKGKYLIPGLWDMHVHVDGNTSVYRESIANGVTGIREMSDRGSDPDSFPTWRREIAAGLRVGPRTTSRPLHLQQRSARKGSSGQLDSLTADSLTDIIKRAASSGGALDVSTPAEARRAVALMKAAGVPWIKLYGADMDATMSREVFVAAAAEARRVGISFAGHRPFSVTPIEASDSGMRSFEHVPFGLLPPCTALIWKSLPPADTAKGGSMAARILHIMSRLDPAEIAWRDSSVAATEKGCAATAKRLARNETWLTPTVAINALRSNFAPATFEGQWWKQRLAFLGKMHDLGVPIMAGTDAGYGGLSIAMLHDELAYYVEGGLSTLNALRTATLNPAKYLHATDSLGSVEPGKLADLVLLDADPLADIRNTKKIQAVVANGRYFDRAALDELAAGIAKKQRP